MRKELKELECLVEKAAENIEGDGNVARTIVKLRAPVPLAKGFKSRFSWGKSKIKVEAVSESNIISFTFSCAILDDASIRYEDGRVRRENSIPLVALDAETLQKMADNAGAWAEIP